MLLSPCSGSRACRVVRVAVVGGVQRTGPSGVINLSPNPGVTRRPLTVVPCPLAPTPAHVHEQPSRTRSGRSGWEPQLKVGGEHRVPTVGDAWMFLYVVSVPLTSDCRTRTRAGPARCGRTPHGIGATGVEALVGGDEFHALAQQAEALGQDRAARSRQASTLRRDSG